MLCKDLLQLTTDFEGALRIPIFRIEQEDNSKTKK